MDSRTRTILDSLDTLGFDLMLGLLAEPAREDRLLTLVRFASQSTVNRRLHRLQEAGLVVQDPGHPRGPGRQWQVAHPRETEEVLAALLALADAIDTADQADRASARRMLRAARAARIGIRPTGS